MQPPKTLKGMLNQSKAYTVALAKLGKLAESARLNRAFDRAMERGEI